MGDFKGEQPDVEEIYDDPIAQVEQEPEPP